MKTQLSSLLAIPLAMALSATTAHAQGDVLVEPYCQSGQQGQTVDCENIDNSLLGWMRASLAKKGQQSRRWWYRQDQRNKNLKHPECPPFLKPAWGYHETCWRQFPPTCPCPPANVEIEVIPVPAAPSAANAVETGWQITRPSVARPLVSTSPVAGSNWQPIAAAATKKPDTDEKVWQLSDPKETLQTIGQIDDRFSLEPLVAVPGGPNR